MGGVIFSTVGARGFFPLQQHICILGGLRPSEIFKSEETGLKTRLRKKVVSVRSTKDQRRRGLPPVRPINMF